jgi:hypothetical protein
MLITERQTTTSERLVIRAAAAKFGRGKARPCFEHGQWWVIVPDLDEDRDAVYSVVDSEPSIADTGLDFEQVS